MSDFILIFGVIAVVLTVTALASGLVERSPLSFPLIFLGLGFLLGIGGEVKVLKPGDIYIIPGGVEHYAKALASKVRALGIYSPVREEFKY
ncbi:MAG TPA: hypothetical protein EYM42_00385 [Dehalococcoidia bacterium]|nr:hypothetical protein [Dehalococcoidia bacterium]